MASTVLSRARGTRGEDAMVAKSNWKIGRGKHLVSLPPFLSFELISSTTVQKFAFFSHYGNYCSHRKLISGCIVLFRCNYGNCRIELFQNAMECQCCHEMSECENSLNSDLVHSEARGGGLKNFNTGKLRPEIRPPTLLYTIFGRKDTPFVYLPNRKSSCHFHATFNKLKQYNHKVCVRNISMKGPFKYLNDRFPYPFIYSTREIPTLSYIPEAWKRYPFRAEPPRIGHYMEYPPPRGVKL